MRAYWGCRWKLLAARPNGAAGGGNLKTFGLVCFKLSKATFRVTCRELGGLVVGADTQSDLSWAVIGLGAEGTDEDPIASLGYDLWSEPTKMKATAVLEALKGIPDIPDTPPSLDASKYCSYFDKVLRMCLNGQIRRGFLLGWAVVKNLPIDMHAVSVGSQRHEVALPNPCSDYNIAMQDVCFGLQALLYRSYGISVNVWEPTAVVRCADINAGALSQVQGINFVVRTKGMTTFNNDDAYMSNHMLEYCTDIPKDLRLLMMCGETQSDPRQTSYFAVPHLT